MSADVVAACEGQRPATSTENFPERRCVRPGCYVTFTVQHEHGVIELLHGASVQQEQFILEKPREALLQAEGVQGPIRDLRLSPGGNRVARQLRYLLDALGHMENWLRYPGLPVHAYDTAPVVYRIANVEGFVCYQQNDYAVPLRYIGQALPLRIWLVPSAMA